MYYSFLPVTCDEFPILCDHVNARLSPSASSPNSFSPFSKVLIYENARDHFCAHVCIVDVFIRVCQLSLQNHSLVTRSLEWCMSGVPRVFDNETCVRVELFV